MPFDAYDSVALVTLTGCLHIDLPQLAAATPFRSVGDYDGVPPNTGSPSDGHSR